MPEQADMDTLKSELMTLRQMTQRIEQEINAIDQATEKATHTNIGAAEQSDEALRLYAHSSATTPTQKYSSAR